MREQGETRERETQQVRLSRRLSYPLKYSHPTLLQHMSTVIKTVVPMFAFCSPICKVDAYIARLADGT